MPEDEPSNASPQEGVNLLKGKTFLAHSIAYDEKAEGYRLVTVTITDGAVSDVVAYEPQMFNTVAARYALGVTKYFKAMKWTM